MQKKLWHAVVAMVLLVCIGGQGTWALAGTTGSMSGIVKDADSNAPIAGAHVTVTSASQSTSTTTDSTGHFTILSLAPDTYTVSMEKNGYDSLSVAGITVMADQNQTVALSGHKSLKEVAHVTSRSAADLVKSGTTADVYSVNASTQDKASGLGGGGSLNSAYSAIATVPGAYIPMNQAGYFQTLHIRGGDYDQVGYEFDGVPVNRSFDNYPSGSASSLGQAEVQVYTGATPANAEGAGLSGYINQVIRTGTYPGFGLAALGIGSPVFYHKASAEAGGASPDRNFSYYVGLGGYNQDYRYVDQSNGTGLGDYAPVLAQLPSAGACTSTTPNINCYNNGAVSPGGLQLAPYQYGSYAHIAERDTVVNLHFGLPHKHDGMKDDVQLLFDNGYIQTAFYNSTNDNGGAAYVGGPLTYTDGYQYNGPVGAPLPANYTSLVTPYLFPSAPVHAFKNGVIPADARDTQNNSQSIFKAQYQHNISGNAYLRVYGYTYYSDWLQYGPNSSDANFGSPMSADYELSSHTRGVSATFADQINAQNLLTLQGSYTTASSIRDNNTQMFNSGGSRSRGIVMVDSSDPFNGLCYVNGGGAPTTCDVAAHVAGFAKWSQAYNGTIAPATGTCGGGACAWYVMENSKYATYNTVRPKFTSFSVTDQFRPSDKLLFNAGLRADGIEFDGSNTDMGPARQFWFNAYNRDKCISSTGVPFDKVVDLGLADPTVACPSGYTAANLRNVSSPVNKYMVVQPRLSGTYTVNPDTVLRFSLGKYVQPPLAAYQQYNTLQENLPAFLGQRFYKFGFTTPGHEVRPSVSNNYDFSFERHMKGTDVSLKLTPFFRQTKDQVQQFFLDQQTNFVSGLNVGRQTSKGVEFQLSKGSFDRNGLSALLSFTYTDSKIRFTKLPNGTTILDPINNDIKNYNAYTSFCAANASDPRCGSTSNNKVSGPCYAADGTPHGGAGQPACAAGDIGNPYWNAPVQGLFDPNASYVPFTTFAGGVGTTTVSFEVPYVASLVLNYKRDKWAITPSLQFQAGNRYGAPEVQNGIDPAQGCAALAAGTDGRYAYGNPGPNTYDAQSCNGLLAAIPNGYTGGFDSIGAFKQPSQIAANLQISYDASSRVKLVANLSNLIDRCFGGEKHAWTVNDSNVCSYGGLNNAGSFGPVGNVYNPGTPIQTAVKYPYLPYAGAYNTNASTASLKFPFNAYVEARIKI